MLFSFFFNKVNKMKKSETLSQIQSLIQIQNEITEINLEIQKIIDESIPVFNQLVADSQYEAEKARLGRLQEEALFQSYQLEQDQLTLFNLKKDLNQQQLNYLYLRNHLENMKLEDSFILPPIPDSCCKKLCIELKSIYPITVFFTDLEARFRLLYTRHIITKFCIQE